VDRARLGWARNAAAAAATVCSEVARGTTRPAIHGPPSGCGRECVGLAGYRAAITARSAWVLGRGCGREWAVPCQTTHCQKALTCWPSVVVGSELGAGHGSVEVCRHRVWCRRPRCGCQHGRDAGLPQAGHAADRPVQVRAMQAHVAELRVDEKRTAQVHVAQGGSLQVGDTEQRGLQVGPTKNAPRRSVSNSCRRSTAAMPSSGPTRRPSTVNPAWMSGSGPQGEPGRQGGGRWCADPGTLGGPGCPCGMPAHVGLHSATVGTPQLTDRPAELPGH
jgi:hypothetical protein